MAKRVIVSAGIPWARELAAQFEAHGYAADIRGGDETPPPAKAVAVLLSVERWDDDAPDAAAALRAAGFAGAILALGRVPPGIDARQRLAVSGAWYLPAFTNPEDVVARVRMILP